MMSSPNINPLVRSGSFTQVAAPPLRVRTDPVVSIGRSSLRIERSEVNRTNVSTVATQIPSKLTRLSRIMDMFVRKTQSFSSIKEQVNRSGLRLVKKTPHQIKDGDVVLIGRDQNRYYEACLVKNIGNVGRNGVTAASSLTLQKLIGNEQLKNEGKVENNGISTYWVVQEKGNPSIFSRISQIFRFFIC